MGALCVIVYDKTHVGQGYTDVCPCVGAETGATDLVRLGEVSDFIPLGARRRVAGVGIWGGFLLEALLVWDVLDWLEGMAL